MSDHRLGESLIAAPLQWLGCTPVTAHNLTLLATFPLCAMAAHWLGFVLTRRHDAAALAGLAFGFSPYRVAHLQHLELLGAFGMPLALVALHRHAETRATRWIALLAAALVLQGLLASYYLLFFTVFLGLWVVWFVRWPDWRHLLAIASGCAVAFVALLPIVIGYSRFHSYYRLTRGMPEILDLSADPTAFFVASPLLALWGWTARWAQPEGELFPGLTIIAVIVAGTIVAWRAASGHRDRGDRLAIWLLLAAFVCAAVAALGWMFAPWRVEFPGVSASSDAPYKPFSVAVVAVALSFAVRQRVRDAYRRRSAFAFYLVAAVVLIACCMGPRPALDGHQFLYEPPYAWLMRLSLFGSIRVPARFAMLAILALAMSAALAFNRLPVDGRTRHILALALMAGIVADGWTGELPLPVLPDVWPRERAEGFTAVVELPLGDPSDDLLATYRATVHGRPLVNGNSGFEPTHYFALKLALKEHDPTALDGLPDDGRTLIVIDKHHDADGATEAFVSAHPRLTRITTDDRWTFFSAAPPEAAATCSGDLLPIAGITSDLGSVDAAALTDGRVETWWTTPPRQKAGDELVLALGPGARPCALLMSFANFRDRYPRKLIVETSDDGVAWTIVATQRTAGLTIRAAIVDPEHVTISIPLEPSTGRLLRMRLDESLPIVPWTFTDVAVRSDYRP